MVVGEMERETATERKKKKTLHENRAKHENDVRFFSNEANKKREVNTQGTYNIRCARFDDRNEKEWKNNGGWNF